MDRDINEVSDDDRTRPGYVRIVFSDAQSALRRLSVGTRNRAAHEITTGIYRQTQSGGGLYARTQSESGLYTSTQTRDTHSVLPMHLRRGPDAPWDGSDE